MRICAAAQRFFLNSFFAWILYAVIALLPVIVAALCYLDAAFDFVLTKIQSQPDVYDFIIVGAGSAGAVVAHRLSENPNWKIMVCHDGGEPPILQMIPGFALTTLCIKDIDWKHITEPQEHTCFGLVDRRACLNQGKPLGGTSNTNFMINTRGSQEDYSDWAKITKDDRWKYENVLEYFKKSESYNGMFPIGNIHGRDGPMNVEVPAYAKMANIFCEAASEIGVRLTDLDGDFGANGCSPVHYSIKKGVRQAVYKAFIESARNRKNLKYNKHCLATKILFDESKRATGIEYVRHGVTKTASARKEVIVSGGALLSAKLLMLSGLGPEEHLKRFGIEVIKNLPGVGQNMQDHLSAYVGPFGICNDCEGLSLKVNRDVTPYSFVDYFLHGKGVLTSTVCEAIAYLSFNEPLPEGGRKRPDYQIILAPLANYDKFSEHVANGFCFKKELLEEYMKQTKCVDSFFLIVSITKPKSRGYCELTSKDPKAPLKIDPKYLDHFEDRRQMRKAVISSVDLAQNTPTFKKLGAKLINVHPECKHLPFAGNEYWECFIKWMGVSLHHLSGTAAMGPLEDPNSVLDSKLQVRGVTGLRVCDASSMPIIPSGNTNIPTIMIGEACADMITKQHKGT